MGTAGTFSFYPSKNLACFGDGGAIVTSDSELAERARILRFHGSRDKVEYEALGYNSRLDELQAAVLRVQLPHIEEWAQGRRDAERHYRDAGLGELVQVPRVDDGVAPAWHIYAIAHPEVERLRTALDAAGIGCTPYYRTPVHRQPPMRMWGEGAELPATDAAARAHLAVPMNPLLTRAQAEEVVSAVRRA
jgi:dTDP-4-amino-4,6-dideoxygalactose transaminase